MSSMGKSGISIDQTFSRHSLESPRHPLDNLQIQTFSRHPAKGEKRTDIKHCGRVKLPHVTFSYLKMHTKRLKVLFRHYSDTPQEHQEEIVEKNWRSYHHMFVIAQHKILNKTVHWCSVSKLSILNS